ncbi:hypothetical protein Ndes2526B_g07268 [Nannochloris sp. 'desiccata']|nr:hypothetical protein KSW81_004708 [Chlorella desiccata (nom. nud.)]KAH7618333.1 hypothetical protein NADE_000528 [Chlorella desiccata (nom. nud.)]
MIGVEQESTEAHKLPSTSGQPSLDVRSPLTEAAAKLLYKRMRITVADGRILIGDFICLDKQGNIILDQTVEQYEVNGKVEEKMLGQVLISKKQRVSCDVEVVAAEREMIANLLENPLQSLITETLTNLT